MAQAGCQRVMERYSMSRFSEDFRKLYASVTQADTGAADAKRVAERLESSRFADARTMSRKRD
jgi:hypothetical protein